MWETTKYHVYQCERQLSTTFTSVGDDQVTHFTSVGGREITRSEGDDQVTHFTSVGDREIPRLPVWKTTK